MFKDVLNIDTNIEKVDADTRSARLNNHDYELAPRSGWIQDYPDPENWIVGLFDTGGGNNLYSCSDPDIDALIEKAHFNSDNTERLQQYNDINELIVTRLCGIAPYYHEAQSWLISDDLIGMTENSTAQNASMPSDWAAEAWGFKS
jgi:ABC-type oligopeptide transport system substrate-binding subunit